MTGDEWLEQVFRPALRAKERSAQDLRGAVRALVDCGVLSHQQVVDALRELEEHPPGGRGLVLNAVQRDEIISSEIMWRPDAPAREEVRGQPFTVESVRLRARMLKRADVELSDAADSRGWGESHYRDWQVAAERFHTAHAAMYPGELNDAIAALAAAPAAAVAVETVMVFLEADPWCFRSGYVKQEILRRLRRQPLTIEQKERLGKALLMHVDAGDRRELLDACKLARRHPTRSLRAQLKERLVSPDGDIARRSLLMLNAIRRPNLSPSELACARAAILDGIRYGHGGRMDRPEWLQTLSRRYWTDAWIEPLAALAAEGRPPLTDWGLPLYAPVPLQEKLTAAFTHKKDAAGS